MTAKLHTIMFYDIKRIIEIVMATVLLVVVYICSSRAGIMVSGIDNDERSFVIVIDAGHGGVDPGKVSLSGVCEKDINLAVALKLQRMLEEQGIIVIMTRTEDKGLYAETDSKKKVADMKARCELVNSSDADLLVSIHQNSYQSQSVKGAQVFYYTNSNEGLKLAELIQSSMVENLDKTNGRKAKSNSSYYLLLNVKCPAVIVECGFLSNPAEASMLSEESYQEKVAYSIKLGIMKYIKENDR